MSIEKGKISGIQLMFLIAGFVQGSILLISFTAGITKHDTWLVVLAGLAFTAPFILSFAVLGKRFPGLNLIQINDIVYGTFLGKVISVFYIFFFIITLSFNLRDLGNLYTTFLMPEAPLIFFLIVFILVCAFAIQKGIEVLARISHLFVAIPIIIIISTFLMLLTDMDFSNFLPVFETPLKKFLQGTHIISAIPFGELIVILTFTSALNNTKHVVKNTMLGFLLGGISLMAVSVRDTAVLGSTLDILTSPPFQAVRLIDVGNVFTRMDVLVGIGQTVMLFLKCSIIYYAAAVSLAQLLRLKSYRPLILPIGGIEAILAAIVYQSSVEHVMTTVNTGIICTIPLLLIFPPLSLLIARIWNLPKQEGGKKE